ncbi:hypothetical protein PC121_g18966 [Phytophthora cactorum]|nr:hypothetical protein PC120_g18845 [Phytophthora cactorum]KAG3049347.1 hypothetical protein PC121_g18966 [Phytophthora cactorum]
MMMAEAQRKPAAEVLRKLEQDGDKRAGPEPGKHSLERGQEGKDAAVAAELHGDKAPELELPGEGTRAARQEDADAPGVDNLEHALLEEDSLAEAGRVEGAGCALLLGPGFFLPSCCCTCAVSACWSRAIF